MGLLEELASGLLGYAKSEPEGLLARGLRQPAGLLGRGLNNAINMQPPGLLTQQDAFFRPSVMATPEERRAQGAAFLQNIVTGPLGMAPYGWTAYHGSPHKFNKFSMDKIGTGEGAQAYGHGLYFAESPEVARYYKNTGENVFPQITKNGARLDSQLRDSKDLADITLYGAITDYLPRGKPLDNAALDKVENALRFRSDLYAGSPHGTAAEQAIDRLGKLRRDLTGAKLEYPEGTLYKVDISDTRAPKEAFLDWDKPLSQQSESVRKAIEQFDSSIYQDPQALYRWGVEKKRLPPDATAKDFYKAASFVFGAKPVSATLAQTGIPGIRYLDAGSRGTGGTYNTVLFDDSLVKILERQ